MNCCRMMYSSTEYLVHDDHPVPNHFGTIIVATRMYEYSKSAPPAISKMVDHRPFHRHHHTTTPSTPHLHTHSISPSFPPSRSYLAAPTTPVLSSHS